MASSNWRFHLSWPLTSSSSPPVYSTLWSQVLANWAFHHREELSCGSCRSCKNKGDTLYSLDQVIESFGWTICHSFFRYAMIFSNQYVIVLPSLRISLGIDLRDRRSTISVNVTIVDAFTFFQTRRLGVRRPTCALKVQP